MAEALVRKLPIIEARDDWISFLTGNNKEVLVLHQNAIQPSIGNCRSISSGVIGKEAIERIICYNLASSERSSVGNAFRVNSIDPRESQERQRIGVTGMIKPDWVAAIEKGIVRGRGSSET